MRRGAALTVSALALITAACTPGQVQRDPSSGLDVPQLWDEAREPGDSLADDWLEDVGGNALRAVIDEAMAANPDLLVTAARLRQSDEQLTIAGAPRLPTLGASFDFNRSQNRITGPSGDTNSVRQSNYQLSGRLNWEIDVWGRLASLDAAALKDYEAAQADMAAARLSLAGNVAQSWFNVTTATQQRDLAQQRVASFERSNAIVRSRYERGITTALDVYLSRSSLATARSLLARRENELEQAKRALETLIGRYPKALIEADTALPELQQDVSPGLPSSLVGRRPDIIAAQDRLVAADYRFAAAKRALLPQFSFTLTGGERAETLDRFLNFSDLVYNLATNITQPIFQGGRLVAAMHLDEARRDERLAAYANVLLRAYQEVENALGAEDYLNEQVEHLSVASSEARNAEELATQQYARGITQLLNLLDAQRRYLDAQSQYLDVARARINNRIQLHLALGGPFKAASTPASLTTHNPGLKTNDKGQNENGGA